MPPKKKSPTRRKKETIVEQVMNERNFVVAPVEPIAGKVVAETALGTVRIEGEVTPEKLALAKNFENIFQQATEEIMDLAAYNPSQEVIDLVKGSRLSQEEVDAIKQAAPWTIFKIRGQDLMKTQDNKLENVRSYVYRLERAVLDQVRLRKQVEAAFDEERKALTAHIELLRTSNESLVENNKRSRAREEALRKKNPTFSDRLALEFGPLYAKLKALIVKLLS